MLIYNVTVNVENSIHDEWLSWMDTHIYDVLNTGKFTSAKLTEVLVDGEEGRTYSVQYTTNSREDLESYYKENANDLRLAGLKKFGTKMVAFRTELKLIKEFYPESTKN